MRYLFDDFILDSEAGELRRRDRSVELRPKVYALLAYLLEHRGRLISKEELLDAIWGNVHVSDGSVNRTIAELRQVLGEDSRQSRLIETVPRRGYRFIGAVTEEAEANRSAELMLILSDRVIALHSGENIVGRTPECDVQIIGPSVSRRHARIVVTDDRASIEDLGSLNGTFVREERITTPTPLADGDEIRIGKERLRLMAERTIRARTEPAL